jgi:ATP-dependent DNA helicase DinG
METAPPNLVRPPVESLIAPSAAEAIRQAVSDNDGGEVFFVAQPNDEGVVEDVEPYAFGNQDAVPSLARRVRPGDVVIHNHPGDSLEPSKADISIGSQMGDLGVGSYIVDNQCSTVHVLVRAFSEEAPVPVDSNDLVGFFEPGGILPRSLSDYEHRPQQTQMAREAARAFNDNGIAVIEAGTGVGKSMAYLLPAILWGARNRQRVVVSTNTINLQEQLISKDLPFLHRHLGVEFRSELLKGRANYLCLRKAQYARGERLSQEVDDVRQQLISIFDWAETTAEGSRSELRFVPRTDAWDLVMSEGDNCLRIKCPFYARCFFYNARRRAARADILVVNHHLLMADLALRRETSNYTAAAVLPPFHRVIFDEAHNLEAAATAYFGLRASRLAFVRQLAKLSTTRGRRHGVFSHVGKVVEDHAPALREEQLTKARRIFHLDLEEQRDMLEEEVRRAFDQVADEWLEFEGKAQLRPREEMKRRVTEDFTVSQLWRETVAEAVAGISTGVGRLCRTVEEAIQLFEDFPKKVRDALTSPILELRSICGKLQALGGRLNEFYDNDEGVCRWLEGRQPRVGPVAITFCSAPLEIRQAMRDAVYDPAKTVIMTSATLAVDRRFDYFLRQVGLPAPGNEPGGGEDPNKNEAEALLRKRVSTLLLTTPFDFETQAYVGVPVDTPEPNQPEFADALEGLVSRSLGISQGRAFVLFTSYGLLDMMHRRLEPELSARGWLVLKQGGTSRHRLLEQFRASSNPILFATSSFWEGVDVKGDALQCLLLTRLPFQVPTEPVLEARVEMIDQRGGNSFAELTVPSAVIRFKQGFGRLIRARDDRGAVLIFDPRVATRRYGATFLRSLPTNAIHVGRAEKVFEQMAAFFDEGRRAKSEGRMGLDTGGGDG